MKSVSMARGERVTGKSVLIIGSSQPSEDRRACMLRERGVLVNVAKDTSKAEGFWKSKAYDLILVDVRQHLPDEVVDLTARIKAQHPQQRIAFLLGPPLYISENWPDESIKVREGPRPAPERARAAGCGVR